MSYYDDDEGITEDDVETLLREHVRAEGATEKALSASRVSSLASALPFAALAMLNWATAWDNRWDTQIDQDSGDFDGLWLAFDDGSSVSIDASGFVESARNDEDSEYWEPIFDKKGKGKRIVGWVEKARGEEIRL